MVEIKYKSFDSKEDLEFELFKELDFGEETIDEDLESNMGRILNMGNLFLLKVIKILDRRIICFSCTNRYIYHGDMGYFIFNEVKSLNLGVGDIINFEKDSEFNEKKRKKKKKNIKTLKKKEFLILEMMLK